MLQVYKALSDNPPNASHLWQTADRAEGTKPLCMLASVLQVTVVLFSIDNKTLACLVARLGCLLCPSISPYSLC